MDQNLHKGRNVIDGLMMPALAFEALGALIGWGRPAIGDIADAYENPSGFLAMGAVGVLIAWRRSQNRLGLVRATYALVFTFSTLAWEYILTAMDQGAPPLGYGMAAFGGTDNE